MWRPNEPVEEDVSDLPGIDPQRKRHRSRRRAWRDGLTDQTVVKTREDVRSYRAFERALVGSVDPRSVPIIAEPAVIRSRPSAPQFLPGKMNGR